jgi:hypothetical protein
MYKRFWAIMGMAWTLCLTSIGHAAPSTGTGKPAPVPFADFVLGGIKWFWGIVGPGLTPDWEHLWWLLIFTIPLTGVWQIWGGVGLKKVLNYIGGTVGYGIAALTVLLPFWGPIIGLALNFVSKVYALFTAVSAFSLDGLKTVVGGIWPLIAAAIVWKVLGWIGAQDFMMNKILNPVKEKAKEIWHSRSEAYENPRWYWQLLGGILLTLLINGGWASWLSEYATEALGQKLNKSFGWHLNGGLAWLIPGLSGFTGLTFLVVRFVLKRRLPMLIGTVMGNRPSPQGDWVCPHCGHINKCTVGGDGQPIPNSASKACGKCGAMSPFLPRDCTKCNEKEIPWNRDRCPGCGEAKPSATAGTASQPNSAPSGAATGAASAPTTPPFICPACGSTAQEGDIFCDCGRQLRVTEERKAVLRSTVIL